MSCHNKTNSSNTLQGNDREANILDADERDRLKRNKNIQNRAKVQNGMTINNNSKKYRNNQTEYYKKKGKKKKI